MAAEALKEYAQRLVLNQSDIASSPANVSFLFNYAYQIQDRLLLLECYHGFHDTRFKHLFDPDFSNLKHQTINFFLFVAASTSLVPSKVQLSSKSILKLETTLSGSQCH
jgi:hypothetical protein